MDKKRIYHFCHSPIRAIRAIRGQKLPPLRQQHHRAVEALRQAGGTAVNGLEATSRTDHVVGQHVFTKKELALPFASGEFPFVRLSKFCSQRRGAKAFAALGRSADCGWLRLGR
jgi:hypothetical protein